MRVYCAITDDYIRIRILRAIMDDHELSAVVYVFVRARALLEYSFACDLHLA